MTNIEKSIEKKANEVVNHFMQNGAKVSKADYDLVTKKLKEVADELLEELRHN